MTPQEELFEFIEQLEKRRFAMHRIRRLLLLYSVAIFIYYNQEYTWQIIEKPLKFFLA